MYKRVGSPLCICILAGTWAFALPVHSQTGGSNYDSHPIDIRNFDGNWQATFACSHVLPGVVNVTNMEGFSAQANLIIENGNISGERVGQDNLGRFVETYSGTVDAKGRFKISVSGNSGVASMVGSVSSPFHMEASGAMLRTTSLWQQSIPHTRDCQISLTSPTKLAQSAGAKDKQEVVAAPLSPMPTPAELMANDRITAERAAAQAVIDRTAAEKAAAQAAADTASTEAAAARTATDRAAVGNTVAQLMTDGAAVGKAATQRAGDEMERGKSPSASPVREAVKEGFPRLVIAPLKVGEFGPIYCVIADAKGNTLVADFVKIEGKRIPTISLGIADRSKVWIGPTLRIEFSIDSGKILENPNGSFTAGKGPYGKLKYAYQGEEQSIRAREICYSLEEHEGGVF